MGGDRPYPDAAKVKAFVSMGTENGTLSGIENGTLSAIKAEW